MAAAGFALGGRLHTASVAAVGVLLYLAAVSAIAYTVWSVLLKYNPVSRIAVYMFLQPVFGVLLSLLFFGGSDVPLARCAGALALICASIVLVNRGQKA